MFNNLIKKIRLFRVPRKEPYLFLTGIGIIPKNIQYYEVAFSHKSVGKKVDGKQVNNERLEYLGDALLDAVAADILYHTYPSKPEGFLTNARAKLVQRETLNKVAVAMQLDKVVVFPAKNQSHNINVFGNAFEALVGALFLDYGYDECRAFFQDVVLARFLNLEKAVSVEVNFKSKLIEWCQKYRAQVDFNLLETKKDEKGNQLFQTMIMINGIPAGSGTGYTKRDSQQKAAQKALAKVRTNKMHYLSSKVLKKGPDTDTEESQGQQWPPAEKK
ncbi:MAG: ribonuclease III [Paludibacteraceae bacterium]|nr:ribonuclease III [Paludibacteraceae bacterium]MBR6041576.1 ribonuclease III [Paludibacteraceae bacterium]